MQKITVNDPTINVTDSEHVEVVMTKIVYNAQGAMQPPDEATIAQALDLLAQMPEDQVLPPNGLPHGSRTPPMGANPMFVGRDDELRELARGLKHGAGAVIGQVATGMGGMGKSQLASEFAYRYGRYFAGGVFWLSCGTKENVPNEIAACGATEALALWPVGGTPKLSEQVALVRRAWSWKIPRLLILDNCEEQEIAQEVIRWGGGCRVLVTSRRGAWAKTLGLGTLALKTLSPESSLELLQKHRPDGEPSVLAAIAAEVGYLPLALHVAGSYLGTSPSKAPSAYLAELQKSDPIQILGRHISKQKELKESGTKHDLDIGRTFALSLARLDPNTLEGALARGLLARAACFAPGEAIPRDMLLATLRGEGLEAEDRDEALNCLVAVGLIEVEGAEVTLHRLLHAWAKAAVPDEQAQADVELVAIYVASQQNKAGYPGALQIWQEHLSYIVERTLTREDNAAAALAHNLGCYLDALGAYEQALPLYQRSLMIHEQALGPEHPLTAISLNNLAMLRQAMGDYKQALSLLQRIRAIHEQTLGPKHHLTIAVLNNIATLHEMMGAYDQALPLFQHTLAMCEQSLGPNSTYTAGSLNNLAKVYHSMGAYEQALPLYQRALNICEQTLGPNHPHTAQSLNNLAGLYEAIGAYDQAMLLHQQALAIREQVLGPNHPDTAQSLNNLASLYSSIGDYEQALLLYQRVLVIREQTLGPDHPHTAQSLNNLSEMYRALGAYQPALHSLRQALVISEKAFGLNHPDIAIFLSNLAGLYCAMNAQEQALPLYQRSLAICEQALGPKHPFTAISLNNLGRWYTEQGRLSEALPLHRRALGIATQALGPDHSTTKQMQTSLAYVEEQLAKS